MYIYIRNIICGQICQHPMLDAFEHLQTTFKCVGKRRTVPTQRASWSYRPAVMGVRGPQ